MSPYGRSIVGNVCSLFALKQTTQKNALNRANKPFRRRRATVAQEKPRTPQKKCRKEVRRTFNDTQSFSTSFSLAPPLVLRPKDVQEIDTRDINKNLLAFKSHQRCHVLLSSSIRLPTKATCPWYERKPANTVFARRSYFLTAVDHASLVNYTPKLCACTTPQVIKRLQIIAYAGTDRCTGIT